MFYLMIIDVEEDKRKFAVLYEKYKYLLMKVARDILNDSFLAEDAVHEAFIKIALNINKVGDMDALATKRYLITITKSAAIDIYRKGSTQMKREIFVDEERTAFHCIEPEYIPEGYQEMERIVTEYWFSLTYENEKGNFIIWDQLLITDGSRLVLDSEYEKQVIREVNGDDLVISIYTDGFIGAYYEHGEYAYLLAADKLSIEEVYSVFQN